MAGRLKGEDPLTKALREECLAWLNYPDPEKFPEASKLYKEAGDLESAVFCMCEAFDFLTGEEKESILRKLEGVLEKLGRAWRRR